MPDAAAALFLSGLLFLAGYQVALLGIPLAMLAPAPLVILGVRRGLPWFVPVAIAAAAGQWAFGGWPVAWAYLIAVALPAALIAHGLVAGWRPERIGLLAAGLPACIILLFIESQVPGGIAAWVGKLVAETLNLLKEAKTSPEVVQAFERSVDLLTRIFTHYSPAWMMGIFLGVVVPSLIVARRLLAGQPAPSAASMPLVKWHLPDEWVWALIAGGLLLLVPHSQLRVVGGNLLACMIMGYALQGWALMGYLFREKSVHMWIQAGFYLVLAIQPVLVLVLSVVGLSDVWLDLRKVRPAVPPPPPAPAA